LKFNLQDLRKRQQVFIQTHLELEIFEEDADIKYMIIDNTGRVVVEHTELTKSVGFGSHIFFMEQTQLTPGVYNIQVSAGSTVLQKKLIIVSN